MYLGPYDHPQKLKVEGIKDPQWSKEKLQRLYLKNNIAITREVRDIKEAWVAKQKGSFKILFKRQWIDPNANTKSYTVLSSLNIYGNRYEDKSIKKILSMQPDFTKQETLLQTFITKLGQKSDRTAVAHCEVASDGIKFDWGCFKIVYRSKPIKEKKSKTKFQDLVCLVLAKHVLMLFVC